MGSGTDETAARVLNENVGRGLSRMGESHTKGLGYMADAKDGPSLQQAYKEARTAILHQAEVEKGVVASSGVLWTTADQGKKNTSAFPPLIDQRAAALLNEVKASYQLQAAQRRLPATEPAMSAEEREAANLVVEAGANAAQRGGGGRGQRGGAAGTNLPQEMNAEFNILLGQHKTALEIRDFLSGEFTPLPLSDLMLVLRAREAAGAIRLVSKK
jgi:hypothetical protein